MEKEVLVGIYDKEIYIKNDCNGYNVIRPVTKETLKALRTIDGLIEHNCDEIWRHAVQRGYTELGLRDFLQKLLDDADVENDDEAFPFKDWPFKYEITDEERKIADKYFLDTYGIEVGTWEWSGCFSPNGEYELILRME